MGAALLKAGGLTAALAGGAFALLQAGSGMEGSLAAAAPQFGDDWTADDWGADPAPRPAAGPAPADFGAAADWGFDPAADPDPAPAEERPARDEPAFADEPDFAPEPDFDPEPDFAEDPAFADEPAFGDEPAAAGELPDPFGGSDFADEPAFDDPAPDEPAAPPIADDFGWDGAGWDDGFERDDAPAIPADPAPVARGGWDERDEIPAAAPVRPAPAAPPAVDRFAELPAEAAARLTVRKEAPETAAPGEAFVYTITLTNPGRDAVRDVAVEEAVPAGATLEGTNPRADIAGNTLRWAFAEIEPGGERVLSVRVTPESAGTVGSVTVVRTELTVAARTAVLAPALRFAVRPAGSPRAGRPFELTYEVANDGTADAAGVAVRTVLPAGVAHASGERDLQYDVGPLPAGEVRQVSLTLAADQPGPVRLACELTAVNAKPVAAEPAVEVRDRQLTLTRTGPRTRFVGREGTFTNLVTNASDEPAPAVRVVETVPTGMRFVEATAGGRFDPARGTVTWDVPALPPRRSAEVAVTLSPQAPGETESRVELRAGGQVEATLAAACTVRGYTAVAPRIEGLNGPLAVGERVAVRVTLKNTGTEAASGLTATLKLPPSVIARDWKGDLRDERLPGGLRFTATEPLAPGATATVEVILEGAASGGGAAELAVSADHLAAPVRRTEPVQVYADSPE